MTKIARPKQSYDAELADKAQQRYYRTEFTDDFKPIYREHIMPIAQFTKEKTPWWENPASQKKRSNSSKAVK